MLKYKIIILLLVLLTTLPFLFPLTQINFELYEKNSEIFFRSAASNIANTLGFIGIILLLWNVILGQRLIVNFFTPNLVAINKIHRSIGKYSIIFIFLHPLVQAFAYIESINWIFSASIDNNFERYLFLGQFALILFLILWVTSAVLREKLRYRPWFYLHYISYLILSFVFLHSGGIGTYIKNYNFLNILWIFFITLFLTIVFLRFLLFLGFGTTKYKLVEKEKFFGDIYFFKFEPLGFFKKPKIGQYFYIQLRKLGESHPLTMMEFNEKTGSLMFGVKILGKFTERMSELEIGKVVNIEGPYGVFTTEAQNEDPKVIIAGGVGATPFLELVRKFGNEKTIFFNCNRNLDSVISRDDFIEILKENYLDFLSDEQVVSKNVINSRISEDYIKRILDTENVNTFNYFICGSKRFIDAIRSMLKNLGVEEKKVFFEGFD
jgi:predicted ferric reductase